MRYSSRKHSQRFISAAVAKGAAATRVRIGCQLESFCQCESVQWITDSRDTHSCWSWWSRSPLETTIRCKNIKRLFLLGPMTFESLNGISEGSPRQEEAWWLSQSTWAGQDAQECDHEVCIPGRSDCQVPSYRIGRIYFHRSPSTNHMALFTRVGIDAQELILLARLLSSQATKDVLANAVLGSGRCFWCWYSLCRIYSWEALVLVDRQNNGRKEGRKNDDSAFVCCQIYTMGGQSSWIAGVDLNSGRRTVIIGRSSYALHTVLLSTQI